MHAFPILDCDRAWFNQLQALLAANDELLAAHRIGYEYDAERLVIETPDHLAIGFQVARPALDHLSKD